MLETRDDRAAVRVYSETGRYLLLRWGWYSGICWACLDQILERRVWTSRSMQMSRADNVPGLDRGWSLIVLANWC